MEPSGAHPRGFLFQSGQTREQKTSIAVIVPVAPSLLMFLPRMPPIPISPIPSSHPTLMLAVPPVLLQMSVRNVFPTDVHRPIIPRHSVPYRSTGETSVPTEQNLGGGHLRVTTEPASCRFFNPLPIRSSTLPQVRSRRLSDDRHPARAPGNTASSGRSVRGSASR